MAVERFHDPHKEYIQVYPFWDVPDLEKKHPEIDVLELERFRRPFYDGAYYHVVKTLIKTKRAALKAGGAGILHRVIAVKNESAEDSGANPECVFDIYLDGHGWYIEHHFPQDEVTPFEQVSFPEREPDYVDQDFPDDQPDPVYEEDPVPDDPWMPE